MELQVLICDSFTNWQDQFLKDLRAVGIFPVFSESIASAQLNAYKNSYFCIIINCDVENTYHSELIKYLNITNSNQLIILITDSETNLTEIKKTKALDFCNALALLKPKKADDLICILEQYKTLRDYLITLPAPSEEKGVSCSFKVTDMLQIKAEYFISLPKVLFDIYIKINDEKYLKILNEGDSFSQDKIRKIKNENKIDSFYFNSKDRRKFILSNSFFLRSQKLNLPLKVALFKETYENYLSELYLKDLNPYLLNIGLEILDNTFNDLNNDEELFKVIKGYCEHYPKDASLSFICAIFSVLVIRQYDWSTINIIRNVAKACLLCDVGIYESGLDKHKVISKKFNPEELAIYHDHPQLSYKLLQRYKSVNQATLGIILQHHERFNGDGFPFGKRGEQILKTSRIVSLCNDFVTFTSEKDLTPAKALKTFIPSTKVLEGHDSDSIKKLVSIFA